MNQQCSQNWKAIIIIITNDLPYNEIIDLKENGSMRSNQYSLKFKFNENENNIPNFDNLNIEGNKEASKFRIEYN